MERSSHPGSGGVGGGAGGTWACGMLIYCGSCVGEGFVRSVGGLRVAVISAICRGGIH